MRKPTDYLREGLPSKIYYLAFPEPVSYYEIAKHIYGEPTAARVSERSRQMIEKGYLEKTKKGVISRVEPLIDKIEKDLKVKNITLTGSEKEVLIRVFNGDIFRKAVGKYIRKNMKDNVDAYQILTDLLDVLISDEDIEKVQRCEEACKIAAEAFPIIRSAEINPTLNFIGILKTELKNDYT